MFKRSLAYGNLRYVYITQSAAHVVALELQNNQYQVSIISVMNAVAYIA